MGRLHHLAEQLGTTDAACVKRYTERKPTAYEYSWEVRGRYEYRDHDDLLAGRRLRTFPHRRK
ncbi:DUF4158 domain-containing protein [Kitasatospora terrestris]|uniref:DUF4158 domain-containing protein n=1 Tax=Kitasatospora terrestris TaxID=258051 RepID=A0ABP9DBG4_9ACTN